MATASRRRKRSHKNDLLYMCVVSDTQGGQLTGYHQSTQKEAWKPDNGEVVHVSAKAWVRVRFRVGKG